MKPRTPNTWRASNALVCLAPPAGKARGTYGTRDGRYVFTPRYDGGYGRGTSVPRGWLVTDKQTGKTAESRFTLRELAQEYGPAGTASEGTVSQ